MDIYVVSNFWREQATIVGAAADPGTAEAIAELHRRTVMGGQHAPGTWGEWTERGGVRSRGSLIWRARQEIVTVPLAGYVREWNDSTDPVEDMRRYLQTSPGTRLAALGYQNEIREIGRCFGAP